MIIGDSSSEDEKDNTSQNSKFNNRESVKDAKNFFERFSKGGDRESTPEFRGDKKATKIQNATASKPSQDKGNNKLKNLFKSKGTVRQDSMERKVNEEFDKRPKRNIFASKKTEVVQKAETIIGDDSSDEEQKLPTSANKNRDSYGRLSTQYNIGAKEGVVQSINLDVATLSNYHEALIKSSAQSRHTGSEKEVIKEDKNKNDRRKNIFSRSQTETKGSKLSDLFQKKERVIGDSEEFEDKTPTISLGSNKYTYEASIEEMQHEDDEYIEASERMAYEIYFDLIDS